MQTRAGWLKDPPFDLTLIFGVTAIACTMGLSAARDPALFLPLLTLHTWCFGYDHVISTYTRLVGRREHRFLAYGLPPLVLGGVVALGAAVGIAGLNTGYFFFQWFHTTRQSWGIAQHYRRASGGIPSDPAWLSELTLWSVPLTGLLRRCHEQPRTFLYMDLALPPVPSVAVTIAGAMSAVLVVLYLRRLTRTPHALYCGTHLLVFALGYLVIDDLHAGWLLVNVWHNAQYLAYVWLKNSERFAGGVQREAPLLSWLCQPGRAPAYFAACLAVSTPIFFALYALSGKLDPWLAESALVPATLLCAFTVNFHHYIVDGIIWRRRT
jgi:hypothetical protein